MGGELFLVLLVAGVRVSLALRIRRPIGLFVTVTTLSFWMVLVLVRVLDVDIDIGLIGEILFLLADSQHVKDEKSSDRSLRLAVLEERVDDRFRGFEGERRQQREDALSRQG